MRGFARCANPSRARRSSGSEDPLLRARSPGQEARSASSYTCGGHRPLLPTRARIQDSLFRNPESCAAPVVQPLKGTDRPWRACPFSNRPRCGLQAIGRSMIDLPPAAASRRQQTAPSAAVERRSGDRVRCRRASTRVDARRRDPGSPTLHLVLAASGPPGGGPVPRSILSLDPRLRTRSATKGCGPTFLRNSLRSN